MEVNNVVIRHRVKPLATIWRTLNRIKILHSTVNIVLPKGDFTSGAGLGLQLNSRLYLYEEEGEEKTDMFEAYAIRLVGFKK